MFNEQLFSIFIVKNNMLTKQIDKDYMKNLLEQSRSMKEVIESLGYLATGSSVYRAVKNKIRSLGLEVPKYNYNGGGSTKRRLPNSKIFIAESTYPRQHIKERIIKESLIDYRCFICNNLGEWNGRTLSLHLDHVNGISDDNRLENLRFLCPNCHSQTSTYAGKANKRR